ncbi:hypothetical protein NQ315_012329 [Exocentrus adspersus]|uniref:Putative nuclease HARBI1 n=1 Tax=Exocentrus adspersus TaxID=1586481 RepID=A0AAV8V820_9CUCU|nr:hypothetical protein NQ315_012329 [Exocentrus adspersus]
MDYINIIEDDLGEDAIEDDLEILDFVGIGFPRRFNERPNYYQEMDPLGFFRRFRLTKATVLHLLILTEDQLEYPDNRNNSLTPMNQLLLALRFYASSGHLAQVADFMNVHESTASRVVAHVSRVLAALRPQKVKMPEPQESVRVQNEFYNIARFPKVQAIIDCTHIKNSIPCWTRGDNAEIYRNRKSFFSINVQCLTDARLKILDVVARWPGSVHDATIFANSTIRARFEAGHFPGSVIIGDSGYGLSNYLMTPLANPVTPGEQLYNEALIRTRNSIERVFGIWKRRFPVMAYGLRLKLVTNFTIIVATSVLHNIAREMNEPEPPIPEDINEEELNYLIETQQIEFEAQDHPGNNVVQNEIIRYFGQL